MENLCISLHFPRLKALYFTVKSHLRMHCAKISISIRANFFKSGRNRILTTLLRFTSNLFKYSAFRGKFRALQTLMFSLFIVNVIGFILFNTSMYIVYTSNIRIYFITENMNQ